MLKLDLSNEAMRFIEALSGKQYKQVIGKMIGLLKEPTPHDARILVGYSYRRVDGGEYSAPIQVVKFLNPTLVFQR